MCTAISFLSKDHYFGRNLDLERSFSEAVTVTPRNYSFRFRNGTVMSRHYALIGMAAGDHGYPLYFDATNEKGLSMAGLNFPGLAVYHPERTDKDNIASFELMPWILGQCATVTEAENLLQNMNLWNISYSSSYPQDSLHWLLSDRQSALVIEPMEEGLKLYRNPIGVLTNNPPFDYHLYHLADFMNVSAGLPVNRFSDKAELRPYSLGMAGIGIPGDLSSASRFVKAAFTKLNSKCSEGEKESVSQFFHILGSVAQQRGLTPVREDLYEYTLYSSCCNTDRGIYYYTTYENSQITAVDLHREDLNGTKLSFFPLKKDQQFLFEN